MEKMDCNKRTIIVILLLTIASTLGFLQSPGYAQSMPAGPSCAPAKPTTARSYDSEFGQQRPLTAETSHWRINLVKHEPFPDCGTRFVFQVADQRNGTRSQFSTCDLWTEQIDQLDVINPTKLLILGRAAISLSEATIVGLPSGTVLDRFSCFHPICSPDHRFLAFQKSFPPHPGPATISDEYIVYDLAGTADYNRPHFKSDAGYDAGWPVYPPGATNALGENVLHEGAPFHSCTSKGMFWLDHDMLAFSDFFRGENRLVAANLARGVQNPVVQTLKLNAPDIVDLDECRKSVAPSDFEEWSKEPAGLIHITDIQLIPDKPGFACLQLSPGPCLRVRSLAVVLP